MASPILDEAARAHAGQVVVLKLNTDENPAGGRAHGVSSIPTFVAFQGGRERDRQVGLLPAEAFKSWIGRHAA
jgi:thioredoxin-like negative regulator of GroEL